MRAHALPSRLAMHTIVLAINVAVFLFAPAADNPYDMIRLGANVAPLTLTGEAWRLLSSMFLHAGWLHLALNMYMLLAFGAIVERTFGALRFTLIYLFSGLLGGLLSALYAAAGMGAADPVRLVISVGASGALMGMAGASLAHWLVLGRGAGEREDEAEMAAVRRALMQTVGLTLLMGMLLPGVDNAAHVGGLLGGVALGACFALASRLRHPMLRLMTVVLACNIAVAVLLIGLLAAPTATLLPLKGELLDDLHSQASQSRQ